ncbi:Dienelactone hydrolase family protein [Symmachiella dynata]|uniref:Dienelactone hydrolase family protein n=1 Tax=Symmachiella dynata TaxID=2527995 RepID=A0A517ZNF6_9PLAN|nr:dienelactone hydrolase family protein [Symmachiella dynata]QDU43988.1 Dienelactone hydrolase family protein [Symmachiella dynata]
MFDRLICRCLFSAAPLLCLIGTLHAAEDASPVRKRSDPPAIHSSWDDLLDGIKTPEQWLAHKKILRQRYLELLRDDQKPDKPTLDLQVHETVEVDGKYIRKLISYNVEADERAHAYLAIPLGLSEPSAAIVALHGTFAQGMKRAAGLVDDPDKAYLDHLARRGYVVIAPEHFVSGKRIPEKGSYETEAFHKKHPEWTAVGKFTYEHSIAVDVLQSLPEVDDDRIGALGHSLGGHGTFFLAAYDERIKVAACNCGASFFRHNPAVEKWSRNNWYVYFKHLRPELLNGNLPPIDFHEIIALIAPRAFLDVSGLNDGSPPVQRQRVLMNLKIMEVFELEGVPQNFGFYVHGQKHSVEHASRALIYAWMDSHLRPEITTTHLVQE